MMTHNFLTRAWIAPIASVVVASHVLAEYRLRHELVSATALSAIVLIATKHVGAAVVASKRARQFRRRKR